MSQLSELIDEHCPEGVEYKKLGDCLTYEQPSKYIVNSKEYENKGIPVLTAGQTFILGYTSETDGIYNASKENPVIIFDDFTTSFHWVDFKFKVKSSAMKMLYPTSDNVSFRYIYYAMKCIKYDTLEHSRQWISKYSNIEIPVPPLPVQEEIVRILDSFTSLEAELEEKLEAELEARKQQYEYYRDKFFSFTSSVSTDKNQQVEFKTMGEIGTFIRGKRFVRTDLVEKGVPCIHYGDMYMYYGHKASKTITYLNEEKASKMRFAKKNDVIIVGAGENKIDIGVGLAWLGEDQVAVHDACYIYRSDLEPRYVSHFLRTTDYHKNLLRWVSEGKICSVSAQSLSKTIIPIPPMEKQKQIADILDKLEKSTSDLTKEILGEKDARQKQYEYYRDKLLTFKHKETVEV